LFDDMGFPSPKRPEQQVMEGPARPAAAPAEPAPSKTPDPVVIDVDDAGFPATPPPAYRPAASEEAVHERSATMTEDLKTGYADRIDRSTPASLARTLGEAAEDARADAYRLEERARDLRSEAAGLDEKPGMREAAENLRREAARLEEDAADRRGMAGAFDDRAGLVAIA